MCAISQKGEEMYPYEFKQYEGEANHLSLRPEILNALDSAPVPQFFIFDITAMGIDVTEMMTGTSVMGRGEGAIFHHPKIRQAIICTSNAMMQMAFRGMQSAIYGSRLWWLTVWSRR